MTATPPKNASPACRSCGAAEAKTFWEDGPDGARRIRLDCARCGRLLGHYRAADVHFEPGEPTARYRTAPPRPSMRWLGFIRSDDGVWRPVAESATLEGAWDCLRTTWMQGDILIMPVRPAAAGDRGR